MASHYERQLQALLRDVRGRLDHVSAPRDGAWPFAPASNEKLSSIVEMLWQAGHFAPELDAHKAPEARALAEEVRRLKAEDEQAATGQEATA